MKSSILIAYLLAAGVSGAQLDAENEEQAIDLPELVETLRQAQAKAEEVLGRARESALADNQAGLSPWEFAQRYIVVPEADHVHRPPEVLEDSFWKAFVFNHYEMIRRFNHPVSGRVQVLDQEGVALDGATIILELSFHEPSLERQISDGENLEAGSTVTRKVRVPVELGANGVYEFQNWPVMIARVIDIKAPGIIPPVRGVLASAVAGPNRRADAAPIRLDATVNVWRIQPPDGEVVEHSKSGYLKASEEGYYLNLTTGEFVDDPDNADLSIIYRFDDDVPDNHESWSVELRALEGGVQESASAVLFEAPLDGYRPVFTQGNQGRRQIRQTKHNEPDHTVYVRARDGAIYSALEWRAVPWRDGTLQYTLQWRSNLEGGRLLQPPGAASSDE